MRDIDEDIVRVKDDGSFEVVRRGGNLAVHVFARGLGDHAYSRLEANVEWLGGYLDGGAGTPGATVRVFTVPVSAGFAAVEAAFDSFVSQHPEAQWSFGNVYDPADGVSPLNWWHALSMAACSLSIALKRFSSSTLFSKKRPAFARSSAAIAE